jgi:dihydroflavonol-4-reductase
MPHDVLLTGASGFIAKRITLDLLEAGHTVSGSLRSLKRADEVRAAVRPYLSDHAALARLSFVELDLTRDAGWAEAMQGMTALIHTASPFPMAPPKDEDDVIRPAVDGTLRALRAARAAGVTRVVLTSSVAAIEANGKAGRETLTEADWSDIAHPRSTPYYKSKTLAERAAWDFVTRHPEMQLTAINPSLVLGRPLDSDFGTSLKLIERILSGKDPMLPDIGFGIVDVADVSAMHVRALERPGSAGKRYIASGPSATIPEVARHLAARYRNRRIATRVAPAFALRLLALVDRSVKTVLPALGAPPVFDNTRARNEFGIAFTGWEAAVDRAADAIVALKG